MPSWRKKPPNDHNFNKRSSAAQRAALADAAQAATARLYADVLFFWGGCFQRDKAEVSDIFHGGARYQVILGGPRRIPPANHVEWGMRRTPASMWFG
jgi:hypothetical protein